MNPTERGYWRGDFWIDLIEPPMPRPRPRGFLWENFYADDLERAVVRRAPLLAKRGSPLAAEHMPPTGQAALWYEGVIQRVPRSGRDVAKQVARLCGDGSKVTIPYRSLADAVGMKDKAGREYAYMQRGVEVLVEAGWLEVETVGQKRGAKTTFYLMPGDLDEWHAWPDEEDVLDLTG